MEGWVFPVVVLVVAIGTIAFVMATPGVREATSRKAHGHDHAEFPSARPTPVREEEPAPVAAAPAAVAVATPAADAEPAPSEEIAHETLPTGADELEVMPIADEPVDAQDEDAADDHEADAADVDAETVDGEADAEAAEDAEAEQDDAGSVADEPDSAHEPAHLATVVEPEPVIAGSVEPTVDEPTVAAEPDEVAVVDEPAYEPDLPTLSAAVADTADTLTPAAVGAVEQVWDGPFGPGSADAGEDGSGPGGWQVKAAKQAKVYLTPDLPVYEQARANVWFVDEQRAIDAGFTRWTPPAQ